ncbi:MAG: hypothetical protein JW787_01335 [Sedimentisphaerales bacterium]|nr:hypothetical protein [Sedimentisphaerales bacterium]
MQAYDFEPMSIGRILDVTFKIYKDNFIRFITIVAIIQIPIGLLSIISSSLIRREAPVRQESYSGQINPLTEQNPESINTEAFRANLENNRNNRSNPAVFIVGGIGMIIVGILSLLGQLLCSGALSKSVSEVYLGNELTVGQAYGYVFPKFLSLLGAGILVALIVYLGFILLIVPGIIFALWLSLTTPAIIIENLRATKGMSRSKALASGNLGKIFSVGFLALLISLLITLPFNFIGGLVGGILFADNLTMITFITQLFSLAGQILIVPIGAIAYILLYYDLRIRKEGFDLVMLANSIGSGQGVPNVGQTLPSNNSEM